jgi:hypothetical protein
MIDEMKNGMKYIRIESLFLIIFLMLFIVKGKDLELGLMS